MRSLPYLVAGIAILTAAVLLARDPKPRTPEERPRVVVEPESPVVIEPFRPVEVKEPGAPVEIISAPEEIRMQARQLGDWVLQLPDGDFRSLMQSGRLDQYMSTIVIGYKKPVTGKRPEQNLEELGRFMAQVNHRIRELNRRD